MGTSKPCWGGVVNLPEPKQHYQAQQSKQDQAVNLVDMMRQHDQQYGAMYQRLSSYGCPKYEVAK